MRAFIYIRVSTDQQAKEGDSLQEQESTLIKYAESKGYEIVDIYCDEGVSGRKNERDELQRLMGDVESGKGDIILFTFLTRWYRNLRHYLNTQEFLNKQKVAWHAVREPHFTTTNAAGRAMISQMMTFGELEAEMTSERNKAIAEHKIAQGEISSGQIPLGYKIIEKENGRGKIMMPSENAEMVKDIFDYFIKNGSLRKTTLYFFENHGISRNPQTVKKMLTNKKYIGEHRGNKEFCPPIVEKEKFEMVQNLLSKNIKSNTYNTYIFSGLIKCACCGGSFAGSLQKRQWKKKDRTISKRDIKRHRCARRFKNKHHCTNTKQVTEKYIEGYLLENIQSKLQEFQNTRKASQINNKCDTKIEISKIKNKIEKWKYMFVNDFISVDEFKKETTALQNELDKLEERPAKIHPIAINNIMNKSFKDVYHMATETEKREIWRSVIDKIIVDEDRNIKIIFLK